VDEEELEKIVTDSIKEATAEEKALEKVEGLHKDSQIEELKRKNELLLDIIKNNKQDENTFSVGILETQKMIVAMHSAVVSNGTDINTLRGDNFEYYEELKTLATKIIKGLSKFLLSVIVLAVAIGIGVGAVLNENKETVKEWSEPAFKVAGIANDVKKTSTNLIGGN